MANCPTDGDWSSIAPGQTRVINCEGETWGQRTRDCSAQNVWGAPNEDYCLPMYPPQGKAFVDFYYVISNSNYDRIKNNPAGIKNAINDAYRVPVDDISVHYVGKSVTAANYTVVQVRVTRDTIQAEVFYKQITAEQTPELVVEYFKNNQAVGDKLMYIIDLAKEVDISYKDKIELHDVKAGSNTGIVVGIVVAILVILVGGVVGFYIWLQIKRNGTRNGSKQLKNTSKV